MTIDKIVERSKVKLPAGKDYEIAGDYIAVTLAEIKEIVAVNPEHPQAKVLAQTREDMIASGIFDDSTVTHIDVNQVIAIRDNKGFEIQRTENKFKVRRKSVVVDKTNTGEQKK